MKGSWGRALSLPLKRRKRSTPSASPLRVEGESLPLRSPRNGQHAEGGTTPRSSSGGGGAALGAVSAEDGEEGADPPVNYDFRSSHVEASRLDSMPVNEDTCQQLLDDILLLIDDERLLVAERLWIRLEQWLDRATGEKSRRVKTQLARPELVRLIKELREKVEVCHQAFRDLGSDENWKFAQSYWGITTHYRVKDDGRLTVRLQGELAGCSVFDQLSVLREADMFHHWGPFINESAVLKEVNKVALVMRINIMVPLIMSRDAVVHVFACDHTEEGVLLVCGESIDEERPSVPNLKIPPKPTGFNADRMLITDFRCQIRITSPTTCNVHIIATLDPKLPLPQPVINFGTKKLAGVFLYCLQQQAMKIQKDPVDNMHARRMREHPFYPCYFIPRVVSFCRSRDWPLPSTPSFEVPGDMSPVSVLWRQALEGTYTYHSPVAAQPTAAPAITRQETQQLRSPRRLLAAVPDALSSWLSWSVMAGMLYLLRQWLVPDSPALDFGLALLLRTLHVIWGDHAKVMRQEAALCVLVVLAAATARCFQLPPSLTYHDDGSLTLRLLPRRPAPPFLPGVAEALRWWDMLAAPGVAIFLHSRL